MNLKQPALGIVATAAIVTMSLGFISSFRFATFSGWVAYYLNCVIPMQIVIGVTWRTHHPAFAATRPQPAKGLLLTALALVVGGIVAAVHVVIVGRGITPPTPILAMWAIGSVIVMFWGAIMWGGWPFTALIRRPVAAGFAMLLTCYIVAYLLFRIFFNFSFMQEAPVYVRAQDPGGLFNAWYALVFGITSLAAMFLFVNFDLWPFTTSLGLMRQPWLGIVWTLSTLAIGGTAFYIGVGVLATDVVHFLTRVPLPFIFGTIVVQTMLEGSLFARFAQPLKGALHTLTAFAIGSTLALTYVGLSTIVTGALISGPPTYEREIWVASALLSVTFPFLIFYSGFFEFWLLRNRE